MSFSVKQSISSFNTFSRLLFRRKICRSATQLNLTVPEPEGPLKTASPKLEQIVTSITALNLLEVAELSDLLKKRLNLPDAPIMPMGGFVAQAAPVEKRHAHVSGVKPCRGYLGSWTRFNTRYEEEAPQAVQTSFTVKLLKFDEKQKVALIKEIKALIEGMNLVQAKKFVESAPAVVKADIGKDEAEALQAALVKVGAEVEIV